MVGDDTSCNEAYHLYLYKTIICGSKDSNRYTVLAMLLYSNLVKVVHGISVGACSIGAMSPMEGKFLFLTGEGNKEIDCPECRYVPTSIRNATKIKCPLDNFLQEHLQNGPNQPA
eukprot:11705828-Ditylum_brightwellii.AAC.1